MNQLEINLFNEEMLELWERTLRNQRGVALACAVAINLCGTSRVAHVLDAGSVSTPRDIAHMLRAIADTLEAGQVETRRAY